MGFCCANDKHKQIIWEFAQYVCVRSFFSIREKTYIRPQNGWSSRNNTWQAAYTTKHHMCDWTLSDKLEYNSNNCVFEALFLATGTEMTTFDHVPSKLAKCCVVNGCALCLRLALIIMIIFCINWGLFIHHTHIANSIWVFLDQMMPIFMHGFCWIYWIMDKELCDTM